MAGAVDIIGSARFGKYDELLDAIRSDKDAVKKAVNSDGESALHAAADANQVGALYSLLDIGLPTDATDLGGRNCVHAAAASDSSASILVVAQRASDSAPLLAGTNSGNTPLHRAAAYGSLRALRVLVQVAQVPPSAGPSSAAASGGDDDDAGDGRPVNARNGGGMTPLARAARWGHADCARALLRSGADPGLRDGEGKSPGDWAGAKGHQGVLGVLREWEGAGEEQREVWCAEESRAQEGELQAAQGDVEEDGARARAAGLGAMGISTSEETEDEEDEDGEGRKGGSKRLRGKSFALAPGSSFEQGTAVRVEGWMAKKGHWFRNWKNRWFVLEGRKMRYYGKQGDSAPKGEIHLVDGTQVSPQIDHRERDFCFRVDTPSKKFVLQAADDEERDEWVTAIETNLKYAKDE